MKGAIITFLVGAQAVVIIRGKGGIIHSAHGRIETEEFEANVRGIMPSLARFASVDGRTFTVQIQEKMVVPDNLTIDVTTDKRFRATLEAGDHGLVVSHKSDGCDSHHVVRACEDLLKVLGTMTRTRVTTTFDPARSRDTRK